MARNADINKLKAQSLAELVICEQRFVDAQQLIPAAEYMLLRWIAAMTAVEAHAAWERYAERRLIAALSHHPQHLIDENGIRGLKHMPVGLAGVLVRGGNRYFDFRSFGDLIGKGTRLLGKTHNPFQHTSAAERGYLDALSAIRNMIVHGSNAASVAYKKALRDVYGVKAAPSPGEFLNALDLRRKHSRRKRIHGLLAMVQNAILTS